jgi:2-ketocyclohexanecarboxyl-CoA hydrolase
VARITINRPHAYNAFTGVTIQELNRAITAAGRDREVGVLVLTGAGEKAFCSGGDVKWEADGGLQAQPYDVHETLGRCPKPVIARVNGYAIGGGNHLAYFCDFTVAAEHAIFGQNGARVGSPASGVIVNFLAHQVGHKRAREMWLLCRRYSARQMLEWGLVNAVVPIDQLDDEVRKWCDDILSLSPTCLKVMKASFEAELDYLRGTDHRIVSMIAPNYFQTGEQQEGAAAFLEKRKPDFSPWR